MRLIALVMSLTALGLLAYQWEAWRHPSFLFVIWLLIYG